MEQVRFLRESIMTGEVSDIEVGAWAYDETINRPGSLNFGLALTSDYATEEILDPYRTAIYAVRGTNVEWGGILQPPQLSVGAASLSCNCNGWLGYWDQRIIRHDYTPSGVDQFTIFKHLVDDAQDDDAFGGGYDLGITVAWDALSGVPRDRSYIAAEAKNLGEALRELAATIDGFDFAMQYTLNATTDRIDKVIKLYYPAKGRVTNFVLEYERGKTTNLIARGFADPVQFAWTGDGWGSGNSDTRLRSQYVDPILRGVYPPYDAAPTFSSVTIQSTLDDHTQAAFGRAQRPKRVPVVTVDPNAYPQWGSYELGDTVGVRITDGYGSTTPNTAEPWRITGTNVTSDGVLALVLGESEVDPVGAGFQVYVPSADVRSEHVVGVPDVSHFYADIDGPYDPNSGIISDGSVGDIPVYLSRFNVGGDDFEGNRITSLTLSIFAARRDATRQLIPTVQIGDLYYDGPHFTPTWGVQWFAWRMTTNPATGQPWTVTAVRNFANSNAGGWYTEAQLPGYDTVVYLTTLTVVFE